MHLESKKSKLFYKICADFSNLYIWKPAGIVKQALFYSKEVTTNIEKISIEAKTKDNWELPVDIKMGLKLFFMAV